MLIATTAAKVDLTAPATLKPNSKPKKNHHQQHQSQHTKTVLLSSGLHFNQQHQQHHLRQHHNKGQEKQQERQRQDQDQQSASIVSDAVKLKQQQEQHHQEVDYKNQKHVSTSSIQQKKQQLHQQQHQQRTMEAMKMLDAKLVAYLTGNELPSTSSCSEYVEPEPLTLKKMEQLEQLCSSNSSSSSSSPSSCSLSSGQELEPNNAGIAVSLADSRESLYDLFSRISGIKLQLEALTLQPEGTKRMELLQNDIRPIFTVECQLSHELIKSVPRYDMFHIMQFESEKFQSLTQCTRFGQEAMRAVKLEEDSNDVLNNNVNGANAKPNFGRIHFTVWWREPGTCLNEMLGMGVLALEELYEASVLEQCKRIVIQRRNDHLANLYLKISVQVAAAADKITGTAQQPEALNMNRNGNANADCVVNGNTDSPINTETTPTPVIKQDPEENEESDKNPKIETINFMAETSRVRLLRGIIHAGEVRQLELNTNADYLVCRRFWEDDLAVTRATSNNSYNYQEQFAVINDEAFLRRVDRQYLQLELWHRQPSPSSSSSSSDGNGNNDSDLAAFGIVRLPLHQFFIAYRDVAITNHLCKAKLPVISFDAWAPVMSATESNTRIGELHCMLAIGSDEQIAFLKEIRHFDAYNEANEQPAGETGIQKSLFKENPTMPKTTTAAGASSTLAAQQPRNTADLLNLLQRSLNTTQQMPQIAPVETLNNDRALPSSLLKPLQASNIKSFRFLLEIQCANALPRNPGARGKKKRNNNAGSSRIQRYPPNEAPSTYVTFQADEGQGPIYKSHEGSVYATGIVEKSTQPQWHECFRIAASVDYLLNPQKRFILKIWKKAATDSSQKRQQQPKPMEDAIIGFAALDLGVFLRGLFIAGSFNIVDFNGRINGQLDLRAQPLEDLQKLLNNGRGGTEKYQNPLTATPTNSATTSLNVNNQSQSGVGAVGIDNFIDEFESTLDLGHLNLGQAIKRKFTELEGISQRLRTRLNDVTGEQLASQYDSSVLDDWQASRDDEGSTVDDFDDFEHDINTAPSSPPSAADPAADSNQAEYSATVYNAPKE